MAWVTYQQLELVNLMFQGLQVLPNIPKEYREAPLPLTASFWKLFKILPYEILKFGFSI